LISDFRYYKRNCKKSNLYCRNNKQSHRNLIFIKAAAKSLIKGGVEVTDKTLNKIEMAFRVCDPCFGCATHTLPGQMPLELNVYDADGEMISKKRRY